MILMQSHLKPAAHRLLDQLGMLASGACALHCLLVPVLLAAAPALGEWLHYSETLERAFVWVAVLVSGLSISFGVQRHGQWIPAALLWALGSLLLLPTGLGIKPASEWLHALLMVPGGVAIALAHFHNWRALAQCRGHRH